MWMACAEIWSDPAFCYSAPAPHCDSKTPASSLIHDLPLHQKKKKKISFSKIIQFYKSHACLFQLNLFPCLNQDVPKKINDKRWSEVANCCQVTKVLHQTEQSNAGGSHVRSPSGVRRWLSVLTRSQPVHAAVYPAARPTPHNRTTGPGPLYHRNTRRHRRRRLAGPEQQSAGPLWRRGGG